PYTVIGIASPRLRFEYIDEPSIFVPLAEDPASPVRRNIYVIGRLAPGVTPARARVELDAILQLELKSEGAKLEDIAAVTNLRETWTEFAARGLYFFAGAVLLVLLIACVNNAGLLLARGLARQREFALRAALGAPRAALMRQSLVESLVLSLAGGAAGALLGYWGAYAFAAFIPEDTLPRNTQIALDSRVLLFVLGVSIFSALLMGVAPALFSSQVDLNVVLRQGASGLSSGRQRQKTRASLVAVEIALALVLLFATGLFLSSFIRLEQAPRGFDAPGALSFRVALRGDKYSKPDQQQRYFRLLTEQLRALPGVRSVTLGSGIPLAGSPLFASVQVAGRPPLHPHGTGVVVYSVAPNFFDALQMHLLAGRAFTSHDTESSPRVAVINRNAVRTFFGAEDPLGKVLEFIPDERRGVPAEAPVQIVGISENVHEFNANEVPFEVVYLPYPQHPVPAMYVVVASALPRGALLGAIRSVVYSLDKDQPIFNIQTMDDRISRSVGGARFDLLLVVILALVGLTLVSVGIFGTVSYFVRQRTQEFGIRLALGATPSRVLRHAINQSLVMGVTGLFFGIAASLFLARVLRSTLYLVPHEHSGMLYGVSVYDPFSMACACLLLLAVLFLASFLPARRATQVDPMIALRYE
ncbi:MAG: FtsX-like permease family protein, partial [Candidatus Acidiferrum sp.]